MEIRFFLLVLTFIFSSVSLDGRFVNAQGADGDNSINISRKQRLMINDVILPSLQNQQDGQFYETYGALLDRGTTELVEHVEAEADSRGLESPFDHFIDLQIRFVEQGVESVKSKYTLKQATLLIKGYNRRLARFLESISALPFMDDPIVVSSDWQESRDQFWEAHVINNEFANYQRLIQFGIGILQPHLSRIRNMQDQTSLQEFNDFEIRAKKLVQFQQELTERSMEARLIRFRKSVEQIGADLEFRDKLVNAMNLALDSEALLGFLSTNTVFKRDVFQQPDLATQIRDQYSKASQADQKIIEQARLFREGSHWWLRGRYGRGALAQGLLKPKSAMESAYQMNALYMPRERPSGAVEEINQKKQNVATFHRRHYYTWAVEEGDLLFELVNNSSREHNPNPNKQQQATFFY